MNPSHEDPGRRGRKQKLYMHASVRGKSFEILRDELCLPLGGQVLGTKVE